MELVEIERSSTSFRSIGLTFETFSGIISSLMDVENENLI